MNYLLWNLFGPASWPLWLVIVATFGILTGRARLSRFATLLSATLIVVLGVLPTGYWLMQWLETSVPRPELVSSGVSNIVVLAGAENLAGSTASGRLELNAHGERVTEALALARRFQSANLWIVGGVRRGSNRRDVDWTADFWEGAGIEPARIRKIGGTLDTCSNAQGVAARLADEPILLVTSGFHMPRAMACMSAAGVSATPYPVDTQIWRADGAGEALVADMPGNLARADLALHEYAGLIYYRLKGLID